jgi:hypothetical protein
MKKIMMILVVLVQTALFAQSKQTIEKPLKLTSVAVGTLADDVLVRGTDKMVKKISVATLFSGVPPQVNADWDATSGAAQILNKPVINLNQKANRGEFTGTGTNNNSLNRQVGTGGIYNDNFNQYDGTFNVNSNHGSNNPNSSFNKNWQNGNQGAFNSNQLQGTTPFNYNLHQGQNAFNDNISVSNSTFERYNSPTDGYTGDLVQFQKKGVLTSRINHLGEFTTPKITITGKTANDILLGDGSTTTLKTINGVAIKGSGDIVVSGVALPYKVYTARVGQNTGAPSVMVLENTLGGEVTWTRSAAGVYFASIFPGLFTNSKTVIITSGGGVNSNYIFRGSSANQNVCTFTNYNVVTQQTEDGLDNNSVHVEIRVYK